MALIALEGMQFHAFHGVYPEEQVLGTQYVVDVYVKTGIAEASKADDLKLTNVNYETVFQICRVEMGKPRKLVETVVTDIIQKMKRQFPSMMGLRVRVRKFDPPIGGKMRDIEDSEGLRPIGGRAEVAWVEDEQDMTATCPRCQQPFLCYKDDTCWCKALTNIHPATLETLKRQFGTTCLCSTCLKLYAG